VTLFTLGFRLFFIQLQINQPNFGSRKSRRSDMAIIDKEKKLVCGISLWTLFGRVSCTQPSDFVASAETCLVSLKSSEHMKDNLWMRWDEIG
jgi:hypothetical protein